MLPYISWPSGFDIDPRKLGLYLLNPNGSDPGKAKWWLSQGYDAQDLNPIATSLFEHTTMANFVGMSLAPNYGYKLIFEGTVLTPIGTTPPVRSVWQVRYGTATGGQGRAGLVTAFRY